MGRVKAMMMEQQETISEKLKEEFVLGSITEKELIDKLEDTNYWSSDDIDGMIEWAIDEKEQYEIDNSQFGAGA